MQRVPSAYKILMTYASKYVRLRGNPLDNDIGIHAKERVHSRRQDYMHSRRDDLKIDIQLIFRTYPKFCPQKKYQTSTFINAKHGIVIVI